MALAPLHKCAAPSCRQLVRGVSRCPAHAKETNQRKPSKHDAFYHTPAWRRLRNAFIASHPLCEPCEAAGRTTPSAIADHRVEIEDDASRALDPTNLTAMCIRCHNAKTARERAERRRG